jgi:hypothetical protein
MSTTEQNLQDVPVMQNNCIPLCLRQQPFKLIAVNTGNIAETTRCPINAKQGHSSAFNSDIQADRCAGPGSRT